VCTFFACATQAWNANADSHPGAESIAVTDSNKANAVEANAYRFADSGRDSAHA